VHDGHLAVRAGRVVEVDWRGEQPLVWLMQGRERWFMLVQVA
jgi:hypothetical protein